MTAVSGYWATRTVVDPVRACERMLAAQAVYAPAPPISVCADDFALGRRLFSVLPEDRYDRGPQQGGEGRWTVVADLRLDNRGELCAAIGIDHDEARGLADATILLRALERWEERAVERLLGDFAFAAWDRNKRRLILARDHLGSRPLHFHQGKGFFAFASMAKGLHALPEVPYAPDEGAIRGFLALVPEQGMGNFFEGIEKVPPGCQCIVTQGGVALHRYWNPTPELLQLKRPEDYEEALREAMDRAVLARLRRGPCGVASHLSGGLDSSTVTATAARLLGQGGARVTAFTSVPREGFDGPIRFGRFADEGDHAASVAALHPQIDHVRVRSGDRSPLAALDRNAFLYERPVLNLCNSVWANAINDAARDRGLSVLLTGQMGNLSFSYNGYERLAELLRGGQLLKLARETFLLRREGFRLESAAANMIGPYLPPALWSAIHRWRGRDIALSEYSALAPGAAAEAQERMKASGRDLSYRPSKDPFASRMWALGRVDLGVYNKGTLGGWGLDVRDPTADRTLIELCLRIPMEQYLRGGKIRALARNAFADRLPPMIVNETRKGLQAADWYDGFTAGRDEAAEEVARLAMLAPAQRTLDVDRMQQLVDAWPKEGWHTHRVESQYRLALLRGISGGHFLRRALRAN